MDRSEIEAAVLETLSDYLPRGTVIWAYSRLIADLRLDSDDATDVALLLEKRFRLRLPRARYLDVETVEDLIEAFHKA